MKKKIVISILTVLIVVGGIFVVRGFTQTGVTALDDSFTREFLDEDVEVGDGFYFYEARNGKYTMWFPEDFYISDDPSLFSSSEHFENLEIYQNGKDDSGLERTIQVIYDGNNYENDKQFRLNSLLEDFSSSGEINTEEVDGNTIYYGSSYIEMNGKERVVNDEDQKWSNRYYALVSNHNESKLLEIRYRLYCEDEESCAKNQENELLLFNNLIKNVKFF
ncbi:hypothetical protein [Alkalicoccobacillus porphyridii]|uniref:Uncharacterized protein n=1 Tax=Alkalicoccobacillus porphyridii TaxID=2597270 RepID=A0A554A4E0_9BACI|nr:hypothetical protein [Alkalicoccobacillus porphyridii]TSB48542.1 hypothetical protein FN960_03030 [Alkalicoccobacillus porphyridii]